MDEIIQSVTPVRPLRDPVLITGLLVQRRGGRLASTFLTQLGEAWHAELIAKMDMDSFYDFTQWRPQLRLSDNILVIDWPEIQIFLVNKEGSSRDLLLLTGGEPHYHWKAFTEAIADYAGKWGVRMLVNLRSFPAAIPYTRPAPILPTSPDPELAAKFGPPREKFNSEGPTDIAAVLSAHAQSLGWQTLDLSTMQPFYFRPMPRGQASIAWVQALDRGFGGATSLEQFEKTVADETRAVDKEISGNLEMQAMIRELEQKYDSGALWSEVGLAELTSDLPSGDVVINEIEQLLRESGPSGHSPE